ncbi:MAG TPA: DMT family transporter [Anaerolineales bacterium]|nr:DMT family transporter [Anaerolineales bacterium]
MSMVILLALTVVSGAAITLQGQFMGLMDRALGTRESVFLTYGSGGLIATLLILAARGGNLRAAGGVPWYAFTAGLLGLVIVSTIGYVVPRLGVAKAFTLIVASQFLLATLIDHFGLFGAAVRPIDFTRTLGLAVMLAGLWLVVR